MIELLKDNLVTTQNHMRQQAYQCRTERYFEVGDWVFIRLQPYKQVSLKQKVQTKLSPKFYGPYHITKKICQVAYELHLPDKSRIHNVFHVSCLIKMLGQHQMVRTVLPILGEGMIILEPEALISTRERKIHSRTLKEYLIRWKFFPDEDASWETEQFRQQYHVGRGLCK